MSSLFNELKRRNVIRVGVTYLVAAWVLLQIGDVLIGMLELPGWIGKALVLALALFFPIVLIFAWAFELTPEGLKADSDAKTSRAFSRAAAKRLDLITIALVIMALIIFAVDGLLFSNPAIMAPAEATRVSAPLDPSVAVLPFENMSLDEENDPFTIGIHDDLLTQISKIRSLRTISRTSVMPYRNTTKPLSEIADELGVATILEGGVQRAGDRVRINVQLIDAQTNTQLWGERYDRQLTAANIFELQSEIVKSMADALQATLSLDEQKEIEKIPTENLAALEYFFQGRERLESRNTNAISKATEYFEQAIKLDPGFALAYVGLADSYQLLEDAGGLSRQEMYERSGTALAKAMVIDSELGAAYSSLGGLHWTSGDYNEAILMFEKAIRLAPNYSRAYLWYGTLMIELGRIDEAIGVFEQGIEHDPLSSVLNESLGTAFEYKGRFTEALKQFRTAVRIDENFASSYLYIGNIHWMVAGSLDTAAACQRKGLELDRGARLPRTWHGLLFLDVDEVDKAEPWIRSALHIASEGQEPRAAMALAMRYRGDTEGALRYAEQAQAISPYYPDQRLLQSMMLSMLRNHALEQGDPESARRWYETSYPNLLGDDTPEISLQNYRPAIDLALVLRAEGKNTRSKMLLDRAMRFVQSGTTTRLGVGGYGIADVQIYALRGEQQEALDALRKAIDEGWRGFWWFYLKDNPNLESLEQRPEFVSMVLEVETRMTKQEEVIGDAAACTIR